jgi:hypothetical protein
LKQVIVVLFAQNSKTPVTATRAEPSTFINV